MRRRPASRALRASGLVTALVLSGAACAPSGSLSSASPAATVAPSVAPSAAPTTGSSPDRVGASPAAEPAEARTVPVPGSLSGAAAPPGHRPVRLQVPAAGIDTTLIELGVATDGSMQVPSDYADAGWLDRSPAPGDRGPAVLAGHVDSKSGPAVFFRLRELAVGDRIVVTRKDGARVGFTVDGVQQHPKNAFPTAAVYGPVPGPVLRLVTCGGSFDRSSGHYRDNIVVFATATTA